MVMCRAGQAVTPLRRPLAAILRDRLAERRFYGGVWGWALSLYDRALGRWPRLPLPGRGRVVRVRPAGDHPVYLRLGTSDFLVLLELEGGGDYARVLSPEFGECRRIADLGANIGLSVRYWQRRFPGVQVVAVEPDAENLALC